MERSLYIILTFIVLIAVAFAFLTGDAGNNIRDKIAYDMAEKGHYKIAARLYSFSTASGDLKAANNMAVLQYHLLRYESDCDCDNWKNAKQQFLGVFEDLARKGNSAAAFNRGMFDFRCSSNRNCYDSGKYFFNQAVEAGDPLAAGAFAVHHTMRESHPDSRKRKKLLMAAADAGDPDAAYVLARDLKNKNEPKALFYADIAAKGGASYAQELRGNFFDQADFPKWLSLAANNPVNPRASAATLLAYNFRKGERGLPNDFQQARVWFQKAVETDGRYKHPLKIREDGFRWRSSDSGYVRNSDATYFAAYDLAIMEYMGIGGERNEKEFETLMRHAAKENIHDSQLILMQLQQARNPIDNTEFNRRQAAWVSKRLGKRKNRLNPIVAKKVDSGKLRFVSFLEIAKWVESGQLEKPVYGHDHYQRFRKNSHDFIFQEAFYVNEPLSLPKDMYGQNAGIFIYAPGLTVTKHRNHNTVYQLKK